MNPALVLSGLGLANRHVGQGAYAGRIIEGLMRRHAHFPFRVIAPAGWGDLRQFVPAENLMELEGRSPHTHEVVANAYWSNRIAAHAAERHPGAVFHSPSPIWARAQPAHTVVTLHDCIYRHFTNYLGRRFVRRWLIRGTERYAARAQLVLTDSEFSRDDLIKQVGIPGEKIRVLYPWVDEQSFVPISDATLDSLRAKLGLPQRFWLYLGGYDYRKNVEFLIAAYAGARKKSSDVPPLVLAGQIPARGKSLVYCDVPASVAAASLPAGSVVMPGRIDAADIPGLYRLASLFVYPSLMEGFGLPPAEAMAAGTPVLVSDTSSLPEVVRDARCRFDPTNQDELRSRLRAAAQDPARFHCVLPEEFTEKRGLVRYLELLELTHSTGTASP